MRSNTEGCKATPHRPVDRNLEINGKRSNGPIDCVVGVQLQVPLLSGFWAHLQLFLNRGVKWSVPRRGMVKG